MLQHILANTPLYVWAILAFLLYRGVLAARERDMRPARMLVIPLLMLSLALQGIAARFGVASLGMLAWFAAVAVAMPACWKLGSGRVGPGAVPGTVRVRGSWMPLVLMLLVFTVKYAMAVALAIRPQAATHPAFVAAGCALLGLCNGCLLGQLARDVGASRRLAAAPLLSQAGSAAPTVPGPRQALPYHPSILLDGGRTC